ncbi:MAG: type IV pilin [Candidatus Heimdallarchaeota archaeon]|nr:type IV pilin [Candidatus Heimdallarchaeota archaeon]
MITKKIVRFYRRRKAVSPVIAAILLIALTVAAVAIVYFLIIPQFRKYKLEANLVKIYDTDKDSLYDRIQLQLINTGTKETNITKVIFWTSSEGNLGHPDEWTSHLGWTFDNPSDSAVLPAEVDFAFVSGETQIGLSIYEYTYYRIEIEYTGARINYISDWVKVSDDMLDLSDLLTDFDDLDLTEFGFSGTIDDPARAANNYLTNSDGDFQLIENATNFLPVLDEATYIPFQIGSKIIVFHSTNGDLYDQPLVRNFDFASTPFRAKKIFLLGLAGSWGDIFQLGDFALNLTLVYTDDSYETHLLNHSYIDDWWEPSNNYPPPSGPQYDGCLSADKYPGFVTHIDLGTQTETPNSHIHTHTTRFYFDYYKYVKAIIFSDPGDDQSGPHLLAITLA